MSHGHETIMRLRRPVLVALLVASAASMGVSRSLSPRRQPMAFFSRAWQRRGVYTDRPDMPPLSEVAQRAGVRDPPWKAPRWVWAFVWRSGKRSLKLLHRRDDCAPTDTNVNLMVCWLKAIGGNHWRGIDDSGLSYDLLPPVTRRIVSKPLASLYPLLHHQNVLLRSAYLDKLVTTALDDGSSNADVVVVLGAGFDLRSLRLSSRGAERARWVEVDLPHVIQQRSRLLSRLASRRPQLAPRIDALTQLPANLTVQNEMRQALRTALRPAGGPRRARGGHAVFVVEALMIYLPPEAGEALLRACVDEAAAAGARRATLCFADRLPNVKGCSVHDASAMLKGAGLRNDEGAWLPKPGLARHMGTAEWRGIGEVEPADKPEQ